MKNLDQSVGKMSYKIFVFEPEQSEGELKNFVRILLKRQDFSSRWRFLGATLFLKKGSKEKE